MDMQEYYKNQPHVSCLGSTPENITAPQKSDSLSQEIGEELTRWNFSIRDDPDGNPYIFEVESSEGSFVSFEQAKEHIERLQRENEELKHRAENAEKELARSQDAIRSLESQVDSMAIQIIRIQNERDDARKSGTPYSKEIHEKNILTIQNQMLRVEARSLEERLSLAEKVVGKASHLLICVTNSEQFKAEVQLRDDLTAYNSARASDNLQKKEDLSSTPTERFWCAACGTWGHTSGGCLELKKDGE